MWLRPNGVIPADPILNSCVLAYIAATTLLESAMPAIGTMPAGPRQADFSDWLFLAPWPAGRPRKAISERGTGSWL